MRLLREELQLLQEPGSYVGEVVKVKHSTHFDMLFSRSLHMQRLTSDSCLQVMGKNKVLVKVHPEGKYVVDLDKSIDIAQVTTGARVALKNDSYTLHLLLPTKVRHCLPRHR